MTRMLNVLKAIFVTGMASGYLLQTCVMAGDGGRGGFSMFPNIGLSAGNIIPGL